MHGLHNLGQGVDDINQIISFVVNSVNKSSCLSESSIEASFQDIVHEVWMRLITHFEDVLFVDEGKSCEGCLQIVKCISHITISSEH